MRRPAAFAIALLTALGLAAAAAGQESAAKPGSPAPPEIVAEIQEVMNAAVARFQALDQAGLLALVSDQYRTGTLTKAGIADQLRTVFAFHDRVTARVTIDDVRMVGEHAWVYSTGSVVGQIRYVGGLVQVASWERELEVARRENGRWRLYGYQK